MRQIELTYGDVRINFDQFIVNFAVKPAVLLMIYFGLFARQQAILGIGGGMISALLSFSLFLFCAYRILFIDRKQNISQLAYSITIFFVLIGVTPFLSALVFDGDPRAILRFSFEVGVAFFLFFSFYYLVRVKVLTPRFFLYSLAFLGAVAAFQVIINLFGISQFRRLTIDLGSVNYTANTFTICLIVWMTIIYKDYIFENVNKLQTLLYLFIAFIVFAVVLLSGTRSAAIALIISFLILQVFGMRSKGVYIFMLVIIGVTVLFFAYLSTKIDLGFLFERYTYDEILRMALIRFELYSMSVVDLTIAELLIGRPDLYTFSNDISGSRIVNTHNFILSLIRYNGILPFIMIVVLGLTTLITYLKVFSFKKHVPRQRLTESTIIVLMTIVFIYSMFSGGRMTRIFSFYIILGFAIGYFDLMKSRSYQKETHKYIL